MGACGFGRRRGQPGPGSGAGGRLPRCQLGARATQQQAGSLARAALCNPDTVNARRPVPKSGNAQTPDGVACTEYRHVNVNLHDPAVLSGRLHRFISLFKSPFVAIQMQICRRRPRDLPDRNATNSEGSLCPGRQHHLLLSAVAQDAPSSVSKFDPAALPTCMQLGAGAGLSAGGDVGVGPVGA